MKKKSIKIIFLITITLIAMTSCSTLPKIKSSFYNPRGVVDTYKNLEAINKMKEAKRIDALNLEEAQRIEKAKNLKVINKMKEAKSMEALKLEAINKMKEAQRAKEAQAKIALYENNISNYQSYDEVMINYDKVVGLTNNDKAKAENILKTTNNKLKHIAVKKELPFYTDVAGNQVNIFEETQSLIISQAIVKKDLSALLNWYDTYHSYNTFKDSYSIAGSDEESHVLKVAVSIENTLLNIAVITRNITILETYFEKRPYEKLSQDSTNSKRIGGWGNAEKETIETYKERVLYEDEKAIYEEAKTKKNPIIYTSKYPNGSFDISKIHDDKEGRAYSIALKSLEGAKQFIEDYPDSKYKEQVNTYIIREEWFTSDTYLHAIKDIPEEMMNSVLMVRQGIMNDLGLTFKEFLDKAPLLDCQIKKRGNDITVILKGTETKFTFTLNMYYSPAYGGMMYVDSMEFSQGLFSREVYTTFQEKMSNILVLTTMYL